MANVARADTPVARPRRRRWRLALLSVLACVAPLLAACGGSTGAAKGPLPLTDAQAQRLAVVRFNGYNAGVRAISGTLTDGRSTIALSGWVDLVDHVGYALATPTDSQTPVSPFLVTWTFAKAATIDTTLSEPVLPIPTDVAWQPAVLDPRSGFLATALLAALNLGSDRPENPLLLVQSSARFLRDDTVRGVDVEVFTGPDASSASDGSVPSTTMSPTAADAAAAEANIRYWVDEAGVLQRVELRLGPTSSWSVLDLTDASGVDLVAPAAVAS